MKEWSLPRQAVERSGGRGLVLVSLGRCAPASPASLPRLEAVTRQLADLLERPALDLPRRDDPDAALAALTDQVPGGSTGWLAGLEIDVGLPLADGRCWAEVLGAWRQPTVLVIAAQQLDSGLPAAATALLRQWQVPLLGLLQWGGTWEGQARRRDGLAWLGHLAGPEGVPGSGEGLPEPDAAAELAATLELRWRQLEPG